MKMFMSDAEALHRPGSLAFLLVANRSQRPIDISTLRAWPRSVGVATTGARRRSGCGKETGKRIGIASVRVSGSGITRSVATGSTTISCDASDCEWIDALVATRRGWRSLGVYRLGLTTLLLVASGASRPVNIVAARTQPTAVWVRTTRCRKSTQARQTESPKLAQLRQSGSSTPACTWHRALVALSALGPINVFTGHASPRSFGVSTTSTTTTTTTYSLKLKRSVRGLPRHVACFLVAGCALRPIDVPTTGACPAPLWVLLLYFLAIGITTLEQSNIR